MKEIHANAKQDKITGGGSSITSDNLTASRVLVSDANGKVAASSVTGTELNYLSGATSSIQTQINNKAAASDLTAHTSDTIKHITADERTKWNGKQDAISGAATTITGSNLTANMVMVTDGNGKVAASSSVTTTELSALNNYLVGEKGNIKTRFESAETTINTVNNYAATRVGYPNWNSAATAINIKSGKTYTIPRNGYLCVNADYGDLATFNIGNIPMSIKSGRLVLPVSSGVIITSYDESVIGGRYMFVSAL